MLALLDYDHGRPPGSDDLGGLQWVRALGKLFGLVLVAEEDIDLSQQFLDRLGLGFDPEVHRIGGDQRGRFHLCQHLGLERGVDVGQEDDRRLAVRLVQLRREILEDVEVGRQGLGHGGVLAVPAGPAEGLALGDLEAAEVDAALGEEDAVLTREVRTHDAHELDRREVAGGQGEEGGRAAEGVMAGAREGLDGVERDGADDEDGVHVEVSPGEPAVRHRVRRDRGGSGSRPAIASGAGSG